MKKIWNDMDKPLFIVCLILFLFGTFNIVTSSSSEAIKYHVSIYTYFIKQMLFLAIGLFATYIIVRIPTKRWYGISNILYFVVVAMLLYLLIGGVAHRGATNWIDLGFFSMQPSEFIKPILIVLLALMFERYYNDLNSIYSKTRYSVVIKIIAVALIPIIFVFLERDLGSMTIIFFIFAGLFLASPIIPKDKIRIITLSVIIVGTSLVTLLIGGGQILTSSQLSRITNWFNPCSNYETTGYQVCNAFIAFNNGGLNGLGVGNSQQKYSYIPEAHTDSVFAIIVEEYGLISVSLIFIAYVFILYRILKISSEATSIRGRYIALGVAIYLFVHILINLGGLFGLLPLTGVPLPFLSYGGSFALSMLGALATAQRVNIETRRTKIRINNRS